MTEKDTSKDLLERIDNYIYFTEIFENEKGDEILDFEDKMIHRMMEYWKYFLSTNNVEKYLNIHNCEMNNVNEEGQKYLQYIKRINAMAMNIEKEESLLVLSAMKLLVIGAMICEDENKSGQMVQLSHSMRKFV